MHSHFIIDHPRIKLGLWLLMLAFSFDFKTDGAGGSPVHILFLFCAIAGIGLMLTSKPLFIAALKNRLVLFWLGFVMIGFCSAKISGTALFSSVFAASSAIMFLFGAIAACAFQAPAWQFSQWVTPIIVGCLLSSVFRYFYAIDIKSVDIADMRYQILSPSINVLAAICLASAVFNLKFWKTAIFGFFGTGCLAVLSITRSFIPIYISGIIYTLVLSFLSLRIYGSRFVFSRFAFLTFFSSIFATLAILSVFLIRPDVFGSWYDRFDYLSRVDTVVDVNLVSRLSEANYILTKIFTSPEKFFLGFGFGTNFFYDDYYFSEISAFYPTGGEARNYPPHVMPVYFFYATGAIMGFLTLAAVLYLFWLSFRNVLRSTQEPTTFLPNSTLSLILFMVLVQAITFNPFMERLSGLHIGFIMSLILIESQRLVERLDTAVENNPLQQ